MNVLRKEAIKIVIHNGYDCDGSDGRNSNGLTATRHEIFVHQPNYRKLCDDKASTKSGNLSSLYMKNHRSIEMSAHFQIEILTNCRNLRNFLFCLNGGSILILKYIDLESGNLRKEITFTSYKYNLHKRPRNYTVQGTDLSVCLIKEWIHQYNITK